MIEEQNFLKLLPIIKKCFLFSEIKQGDQLYQLIQKKAQCLNFNKGELVGAQDLGVVISGEVQILSSDHSPRPIILNIIEPVGIFRAATIFEAEALDRTIIRASKKAKILLFSPDLLLEMFVVSPLVLQRYLTFLANRINFLHRKIQTLTAGCAEERLLLFLADYESQVQQETFVLPMKANQLATALNMSRATLYRAIEELEAMEIIQYQDKQIVIKNSQAIKNMLKKEAMNHEDIS